MDKKQEFIEEMFKKDILVSHDLLEGQVDISLLGRVELEGDLLVLNKDYSDIITKQTSLVDWYNIDGYRVAAEKGRNEELYQEQLQGFKSSTLSVTHSEGVRAHTVLSLESELGTHPDSATSYSYVTNHIPQEMYNPLIDPSVGAIQGAGVEKTMVNVVISYINKPRKYNVQDFTNFFLSRYRYLESLLKQRQELKNIATINRILQKKEKENVAVIGIIEEIGETKSGNVIITLEDPTGKIKVVITKKDKDLFAAAKDLVVDEVIGVAGMSSEKFIFANNLVWPDIPSTHELKKGPEEEYAIFLSDIHVGSKLFLKEEFAKFIRWINGQGGNEIQKDIASKVRYIFIAGDLVDGVGIYPSQEEELEIKTIEGQYTEFTRLIRQIPTDKQIIMCPGNHDVVHLAEPQPIFYTEFASDIFSLPNVTFVTNPAVINIGKKAGFEGFNVLMYHGYSFDYYVANVESIRTGGGYHRSDLIMKFLLKRRHLAPSFSSTPYHPSHTEDPLLIKKIPDIFITGHIHYCCVANYKGITMISGSCWQGKTTFQEKLGHEPEPARVPLINLKTREVKVLRFG